MTNMGGKQNLLKTKDQDSGQTGLNFHEQDIYGFFKYFQPCAMSLDLSPQC